MIDYKEIERMRNLNDSLIWDRMKMCYDYGYNRGCKDKEEEIGEIRRKEYHRGYDDGVANTPFTDTEKAEKSAYQRGLDEAWECARNIVDMSDIQLSKDYELVSLYHVLNEMSASEVMQKIKDYEERKEAKVSKAVNEGIKNISAKIGVNFYDDLQEQQTGKWIKIGNTLECPFCGAMGEDIKDDYCFNYCPNCGADMRKEIE